MDDLARLRWQCRRGTKELDFLLNRYLEMGYLVADQQEKELFKELLRFEDNELSTVLMAEAEVPEEMKVLAGKIHNFYID